MRGTPNNFANNLTKGRGGGCSIEQGHDLNNKSRKEINRFLDSETPRISRDFNKFRRDFNSGLLEPTDINITPLPGFEYEQISVKKNKLPKKAPRPESVKQAQQDFLASIQESVCICALCGRPIKNKRTLNVEHGHAKVHGGTDDRENLFPSHESCNRLKGGNSLEVIETYHHAEKMEVVEVKFEDIRRAQHAMKVMFNIETGFITVEGQVTDIRKKTTKTFMKYDPVRKTVTQEMFRGGKQRYYNHTPYMYGRGPKGSK